MTARDRTVLLVVLAVAILGGAWFTVLAPKREQLKAVDAKIATEQTRLDKARAGEATAQAAKRDYERDYATVARLGKAVPTDDDVSSLMYQLESAADGARVDFRALKLAGGPSSASTSSSSAPATQAAAATLPPGATVGTAGFPTMPFSFVFDGDFFAMQRFLRKVDAFTQVKGTQVIVSGRLLTIDGISLAESRDGFPKVKATLSATAYLLPAEEGATAARPATGAQPAAPAATPGTATASASTPTPNGAG
jgi:hypothetical protein